MPTAATPLSALIKFTFMIGILSFNDTQIEQDACQMTLSLEYALSVNHVGSTPTPGDDMAVAACTDVGYWSGKFEDCAREATDVFKRAL